MAEDIKKTVIIKIDLDTAAYKKELQLANSGVAILTKSQAELRKAGMQSSAQFADNQVKLAKYSKEVSDLKRVINNATEANAEQTGSNKQLSASISVQTYELNKKSEAWKTQTTEGKLAVENLLNTTEALKANKAAVADNRMNVGNYENSLAGLRAEMKAAKSEMLAVAAASGMDSKEFQEAANKAGALKDKLDDINTAAKATATGSDLGKFKNQLKDVGSSLMDLDFAEAAERAKGLSLTVKSFSFSGMISGGKALAVTLYEVGASMLALPIVWIGLAIAGVVTAFHFMAKASQDSVNSQVDSLGKLTEAYTKTFDNRIAIEKAFGRDTQKLEENRLKAIKTGLQSQINSLQEYKKSQDGIFGKGDWTDEQQKKLDELTDKYESSTNEILVIQITGAIKRTEASKKAIKESEDSIKESKAKLQKLEEDEAEQNRKRNEERLADNMALLVQMQNQKVELIKDDEIRELAKAALDNQRAQTEIVKSKADNTTKNNALLLQQQTYEQTIDAIKAKHLAIRNGLSKKELQAQKTINDKGIADQEAANAENLADFLDADAKRLESKKKTADEIKALEDSLIASTKEGINSVFAIQNNQREAEIQGIEQETKTKIDALQTQADTGIITQQEFETKSNRIKIDAAAKEKVIKEKQFESGKKLALINVTIKTAEAVMAALTVPPPAGTLLAAAALITGGLQAGVIASQAMPAFAEGGLTGKRITSTDGVGISRSNGDNLLATVRTGEVILNESQQAALGGDNTFRSIGVAGFASGGKVGRIDGALANRLSLDIDNSIRSINLQNRLNRTAKAPVVLVESIINAVDNTVKVTSRGNI